MKRGFFHTRNTAFDSGSATVPVAPFGVPPNGPETGADLQIQHHTAITNAFGRRPLPVQRRSAYIPAVLGAFQSPVCNHREHRGTRKFREPVGWKACASVP